MSDPMAIPKLEQCGKEVSVKLTFRDAYEAAVFFDELAETFSGSKRVSLTFHSSGRWVRKRVAPKPRTLRQRIARSGWLPWLPPLLVFSVAVCWFL